MGESVRRTALMTLGWLLLLLAATAFFWAAKEMAHMGRASPGPINEVLRGIVLLHQSAADWILAVPLAVAAVGFAGRRRIRTRSWLAGLFLLASILWCIALLGVFIPLLTHAAVL